LDRSGLHRVDAGLADIEELFMTKDEELRQLIEDLISAMEYHVEQTRPIHSTTVALQAAREALKTMPTSLVCDCNQGQVCHVCDPITPPTQPAVQEPVAHSYASTQATMCACCGEHKHTPLRIDKMGGYVCLTCIDKKLGSLLGEFGYPAAQPAVPDAITDDSESLEYRTGWNDCRAEMLKGMKP
jgi:hypothetical protein